MPVESRARPRPAPGRPSPLPIPATPLPRHRKPRSTALVPLAVWLFLGWIVAIPLLAYIGLRMSSDSFTESVSLRGEFRVSFPGEATWFEQGAEPFNGPSAVATRSAGQPDAEVYRLSSERVGVQERPSKWELSGHAGKFTERDAGRQPNFTHPTDIHPKIGYAYVDFEWNRGVGQRGVGRVLVSNRHVVYLTVTGQNVHLHDDRVQKFFASFRPYD